jgi:hypothetical protein
MPHRQSAVKFYRTSAVESLVAVAAPLEAGSLMLSRWWKQITARESDAEPASSTVESAIVYNLKQRGCFIREECGTITSITGSDQFTDDDLAALIDCRSLRELDLQRSPITDDGMAYIGKIVSLVRLHLGYTSVTANGLVHLRGLKNLHSLDLTGTSIVIDDAIDHLQTLASLRWLDLRMTPKTEASAAAIKHLRERNPHLSFHPGGLPGLKSADNAANRLDRRS